MLVQQFQRPTRLVAVLTALLLVYLCFSYLQRIEFAASCGLRVGDKLYQGPFGKTQTIGTRPAMMPGDKRARIGKVGVAVNALNIPVVHRAFRTHQVHNELHGYPHFIADREVVSDLTETDLHHQGKGAYTKPAYLLAIVIAELLKPAEERLEWLFWFDGDTMILNPSTPLEIFLPPNSTLLNDVHLVISANWDGLNSGAFALRVHPWTASMLSSVLAYPVYERERTRKDRFRDQSAFQFLLTHGESPMAQDLYAHQNHWAKVPMRWFNSLPVNNAFYQDGRWMFGRNMTEAQFDQGTKEVFDDGRDGKIQPWKVMRGDLLVHFAGTKYVRDSWMVPWLDRAEKNLPEWNNATYSQELAQEVADYWRDYETEGAKKYNDAAAKKFKDEKNKKEKERKDKEAKEKADREAKQKAEKEAKERAAIEAAQRDNAQKYKVNEVNEAAKAKASAVKASKEAQASASAAAFEAAKKVAEAAAAKQTAESGENSEGDKGGKDDTPQSTAAPVPASEAAPEATAAAAASEP